MQSESSRDVFFVDLGPYIVLSVWKSHHSQCIRLIDLRAWVCENKLKCQLHHHTGRAHSSAAQTGLCYLPSIFRIDARQSTDPNYFIHHQENIKYLQSPQDHESASLSVWIFKGNWSRCARARGWRSCTCIVMQSTLSGQPKVSICSLTNWWSELAFADEIGQHWLPLMNKNRGVFFSFFFF